MTKNDLVNEVAKRTDGNYALIEKVINTALQASKEAVVSGETIYIRGFGTMGPKLRKAKVARNISKGTMIAVPERKVPYFKPSKEFKEETITGMVTTSI